MSTLTVQIGNLLEKMVSVDKDFRFMATNDLMSELQKDSIKLDDDIERRITKALLKLLEDKNGEVQNLAVKCLAPLVAKAKPPQIELIVEMLCKNLESDQERLRDVSSIALKTVVNELSPEQHKNHVCAIIGRILPRLLNGLRSERSTDSSIKIEIMDIVGIIVNKFNRVGGVDFNSIEDGLFLQLGRERQALRKRAITVLGFLVDAVDDNAYEKIVGRVLDGLRRESEPNYVRAYVLAAATICKSTTRVFIKYLGQFIELLIGFCRVTEDDELKDACLHSFEIFISCCSKEVTPFLPSILSICTELICYDPNYSYDEDDEVSSINGDMMEVDGDKEDDDSEPEDYSDDDDISWKARRSAAKCLEALITHRPDRLLEHYKTISPLLLTRFKEREESVKLDIFRAYEALLKQTRLFLPESLAHLDTALYHSVFNVEGQNAFVFSNEHLQRVLCEDVDEHQRTVLNTLSQQVPKLLSVICKQMKSKSASIRLQSFALLISLLRALPGALADYFHVLMPAIKQSVTERSADSSTKIDTLQFLHICFCSHEPTVFRDHLDALVSLITNSVNEQFYKIGSVALLVLQSLIIVLRQLSTEDIDFLPYLEKIYRVVIEKLKVNDIDQEVKERSITSAGILLSTFGSKMPEHVKTILPLLLDRLRNEMTRHYAVQTFCVIVSGMEQIDLSAVLDDLLTQLSEFLRKNQRALRVSTLTLLSFLITKYQHSNLPSKGVEKVIRELPAIMVDQDLYISQLAVKLSREIIVKFPASMASALPAVVNSCITLIKSSQLIGRSLDYAVELFVAIVKSPIPSKPKFTDLIEQLTAVVYGAEKPSRQISIAVATIMAHSAKATNDEGISNDVLNQLVELAEKECYNEGIQIFALYAFGEMGRVYPEIYEKLKHSPEKLIMKSFNSSTEDVKTVASYALGGLVTGNVSKYLPLLLKEIKNEPRYQYLLLNALKESIASQNAQAEINTMFVQVVDEIWEVLLNHSQAHEESTRNVVAECMGKLCKIAPLKFLPQLIEISGKGQNLERGTAATAVRFMIVDSSSKVADEFLQKHLGELLRAIDDDDLNVRRTTIMTLNSAAHNKPRWVKELLPKLLPSLYRETAIKKELIHEVEMGPFKHIVDDGLDLRKSAYECMYTLMEHCLDKIGILEYMTYIEEGLKDQHDIKLLNLLMLTRLSHTCASQVSQRIDQFVDLMVPLLHLKPRPNSVKQENDKLDELKRACIRTILSLRRVAALERSPKLLGAYEAIRSDTPLKLMMEAIEKDSTLKLLSLNNDDVLMDHDY